MMQSKPVIIVAAIIAGIIGIWVGLNVFTSGFAQILGLVMIAAIGYLIYNGLSRNRSVEKLSDAERARILGETPTTGARVLVYREGFVAKLSGIDVAIDGVPHAQLKSPQSVAIDLVPGNHALVLTVAGKAQPPFAFSLAPGEVAAVRIGMGMTGPEVTRESAGAALRAKLATMLMVRDERSALGAVPIGAEMRS